MRTMTPSLPQTFRTPAEAQALAAKLQSDDPDWTYTVELLSSGWALVVCHDEDGILIHRGM